MKLINRGKSNDDIARTHLDSQKSTEKQKLRDSRGKGLVYAIRDGTYDNRGLIYFYVDGVNDILLARRISEVNTLCFHKGTLYDAGVDNLITETLSKNVIASRIGNVNALISHNGAMYDAGDYDEVYDTLFEGDKKIEDFGDLSGEVIGGKEIAQVNQDVKELYRRKGNLFHLEQGNLIDTVLGNRVPIERDLIGDKRIEDMCIHKNQIYLAAKSFTYRLDSQEVVSQLNRDIEKLCSHKERIYALTAFDDCIYDVLSEKEITSRQETKFILKSINGTLYDAGVGLYDTLKNKVLVEPDKEKPVTAICGVDRQTAKKIIENESTNK